MEQREALQHVEPPDQIKKKSFSQSTRAVEQSSDLICFQEPFCFLLSCCALNGEPAEGSVNPCCTTLSWSHQQQMLDTLVWVTYTLSLFYRYRRLKADQSHKAHPKLFMALLEAARMGYMAHVWACNAAPRPDDWHMC